MKQKKPVYLILASIASLFLPLIYWQFDANLNFTDVTDPVKPSNDTFPSSLNTTKLPAFVRNDMVSNVFYIAHDVFKYGVCEYQNVCVASNETIIYTTTPKAAEELTKKYKNCAKGNDAFCRCNKRSGVRFLPINNQITFESEPTWLMYQWLPRHHIAHFAFSMIQFHSILLHRDFYTLPNFTTLLFQDNPSPSSHTTATSSKSSNQQEPSPPSPKSTSSPKPHTDTPRNTTTKPAASRPSTHPASQKSTQPPTKTSTRSARPLKRPSPSHSHPQPARPRKPSSSSAQNRKRAARGA
ncbi:hypothetical protein BCR33DRAFT_520909 [Rhizoclosmatium globosum]|uniref:Uncharacterized protein n=1 Tax=Rhizoclosmatium globosum TaxID=329046 RepID=A0A1Y2BET9_9FUNG|nr:hypothetical protein BCR33DRAFT_520909 [Rhizoclosmatium globosum]|eukprot:ORY33216.1 hypothetical protein BCR33DRAFT_520909 [Rhizoclosmatium globosum]